MTEDEVAAVRVLESNRDLAIPGDLNRFSNASPPARVTTDARGEQTGNSGGESGVGVRTSVWAKESTLRAMNALDVWASVFRALKGGQSTLPNMDAIFDVPVPYLDKFQMHLNGAWISDWEKFRSDQKSKADCPEALIYLSVNWLLSRDDGKLKLYAPILLRYFPRQGIYEAKAMFQPGNVPRGHEEAIRDVVLELRKVMQVNRPKNARHPD